MPLILSCALATSTRGNLVDGEDCTSSYALCEAAEGETGLVRWQAVIWATRRGAGWTTGWDGMAGALLHVSISGISVSVPWCNTCHGPSGKVAASASGIQVQCQMPGGLV
jgi:hypothetical protein